MHMVNCRNQVGEGIWTQGRPNTMPGRGGTFEDQALLVAVILVLQAGSPAPEPYHIRTHGQSSTTLS